MVRDNKIWIGVNTAGDAVYMEPKMSNRHGLIAGATGSGKTVTLKVLAETFSRLGVPVFLSDVKGDLAGLCMAGEESPDMNERIERFKLNENHFEYTGFPSAFWDIYGQRGIQLRTTISEMGPVLLSRILGLNDLQSDILNIVFRIADEEGLLLIDTKDLKAMLNYVSDNNKDFEADYGRMSPVSISAIIRSVVALEIAGGDKFFGETALNINDFLTRSPDGRGMINILDSTSLVNNGTLYSTFLLWLLSELFETLPEVGDLDRPKLVFFFDEAHLLFNGAPKVFLDKIEQVVKLIRSKGVGIFFITQNPGDIPDGILSQLSNKVEHALHAYTPADQKAVKAAAESFRVNPAFDTFETIMQLGTGEAVVSFPDENGVPSMAERVFILPPESKFGGISEAERDNEIKSSLLFSKYANAFDPDSAFEFLQRRGLEAEEEEKRLKEEAEAEKQRLKEEAEAEKQREKEEAAALRQREREEAAAIRQREKEEAAAIKQAEREKAKKERQVKQAAKSVGNSVAGTVGREVGKQVGKSFGSFGKTLGGNVGASLGRGILSTLFKL